MHTAHHGLAAVQPADPARPSAFTTTRVHMLVERSTAAEAPSPDTTQTSSLLSLGTPHLSCTERLCRPFCRHRIHARVSSSWGQIPRLACTNTVLLGNRCVQVLFVKAKQSCLDRAVCDTATSTVLKYDHFIAHQVNHRGSKPSPCRSPHARQHTPHSESSLLPIEDDK